MKIDIRCSYVCLLNIVADNLDFCQFSLKEVPMGLVDDEIANIFPPSLIVMPPTILLGCQSLYRKMLQGSFTFWDSPMNTLWLKYEYYICKTVLY